MYQANIEVLETENPDVITIRDISTGDETPTSRKITVFKTSMLGEEFTFSGVETEVEITGLCKDYALNVRFEATVASPDVDSVYTKEIEFALLTHSKKLIKDRAIELEINEKITDKKSFISVSNEITYYMNSAVTFVSMGDLVSSQKCLDYIKDLTNY
jgi:hypothetical protein